MPSFKNNLKLNYNELQQAVIQVASADPTTGNEAEGQFYYNSTSKEIRYYDGTTWQAVGTGGGSSTLAGLTDTDLTGLSDANYLYYDNGTATWKVRALDASVVSYSGDLSGATVEAALNGADSRLDTLEASSHDAVTIGTGNGLSLSTQELSLALATTSLAGALSNTDKQKLDNTSGTNTGDQNIFQNITDGSNIAAADTTTDTFTLQGSSGLSGDVTVTIVPASDTATITLANLNADSLEGQNSAYHLARANHTGTQIASTISDFTTAARATISADETYISYNSGTGIISAKNLLITDVTVDNTETSMANYVTANYTGSEHQEGDIIILTNTTETESWIHNGGVATTIADFTQLTNPVDVAFVRAALSGGDGINYNSTTGEIAIDLLDTGSGLQFAGGGTDELALVTDGTTVQVNGSNQLEVIESGLTLDNLSGTLSISKGGTGQVTAVAAFDALAPTTTKGDVIVFNGTDNIRLAVGTDGQTLASDSTQASGLAWVDRVAKYTTTFTGGGSGIDIITHSLNTRAVLVQVYEDNGGNPGEQVLADVEVTGLDTVEIVTTGAATTYHVVVMG
jgi:hypothetical protein